MAKKKTTAEKKSRKKQTAASTRANKETNEAASLRLKRIIPISLQGLSSNHFVVQHEGSEFHLLYFQTQHPLVLGETEEERSWEIAQYKAQGVPSICVGHIVVSADRMQAIIKAMQGNLDKYHAAREVQSGRDK